MEALLVSFMGLAGAEEGEVPAVDVAPVDKWNPGTPALVVYHISILIR